MGTEGESLTSIELDATTEDLRAAVSLLYYHKAAAPYRTAYAKDTLYAKNTLQYRTAYKILTAELDGRRAGVPHRPLIMAKARYEELPPEVRAKLLRKASRFESLDRQRDGALGYDRR